MELVPSPLRDFSHCFIISVGDYNSKRHSVIQIIVLLKGEASIISSLTKAKITNQIIKQTLCRGDD